MKKDKCSICNDEIGKVSGEFCLDNPKHPTYEERYDIWDDYQYSLGGHHCLLNFFPGGPQFCVGVIFA